eukprot:3938877-Rhodomonas_salina.1
MRQRSCSPTTRASRVRAIWCDMVLGDKSRMEISARAYVSRCLKVAMRLSLSTLTRSVRYDTSICRHPERHGGAVFSTCQIPGFRACRKKWRPYSFALIPGPKEG